VLWRKIPTRWGVSGCFVGIFGLGGLCGSLFWREIPARWSVSGWFVGILRLGRQKPAMTMIFEKAHVYKDKNFPMFH
jgi:hypothetical protein